MKLFKLVSIPVLALAALVALAVTWRPAPSSLSRAPRAAADIIERPIAAQDARIVVEGGVADISRDGWSFTTDRGAIRFSYGAGAELVRVSEHIVELVHRDGIRERLESQKNAIEQSFVIEKWAGGDSVIEASLTSELSSRCNPMPGAGITFAQDDKPAIVYRKAVAIDAAGRSLPLSICHDGRTVRMAIPADWMAAAEMPVILDPIVGSAAILDTGVSALAAGGIMHRYGAAFAAGHYFVAWQSGTTVKTQRVTAAGAPVGSPVSFAGRHPQVAYSPSASSFLVVYDDDSLVLGQRFNSDGTLLGAAFTIGDAAGVWDRSPHICWGGSRWFVVWNGAGTVFGQFVNTDATLSGTPLNCSGTNTVLGTGSAGDHEPPRVAFASGTYLVICRDLGSNVVAYRVSDATSSVVGSTLTIGGQTFARFADVAARPSATSPSFLVLWPDAILAGTVIQMYLYCNVVTATGVVSAPTTLEDTVGTPEMLSSLTAVTYQPLADQYVAAYGWSPDSNGVANAVIRLQRITSAGAAAAPYESTVTNIMDPHEAVRALTPGSGTGGILAGIGPVNTLYTQVWAASGSASAPPEMAWPPAQLNTDGVTPLASGATASGATVHVQATVSESDAGQTVRIQVEVRKTAIPFQNVMTHESPLAPAGSSITLPVALTENGQYHWQIRAVDSGGAVSAWVPFSGAATHFVIPNQAPAVPASLQQLQGTTPIATGGWCTASTMIVTGLMTDDGTSRLQIEVRPVGTAFTNAMTHQSPLVASGTVATISATVTAGPKHWQARSVDSAGLASAWVPFGSNAETVADVVVDFTLPSISITSPSSSATIHTMTTPITLGGTTFDTNGLASLTWSNAATGATGTATVTATTWTSGPITLTNATSVDNVITMTATDAAGNTNTDTVTVKYDTTAPAAFITTPSSSPATAAASPMTIGGSASDNVGVSSVTWSNAANGASGTATGTANWAFSASLASGSNTITVVPHDAAGNVGSVSVVVLFGPAIGVSPSSLSFSATPGGANPAAQNVNITNTGGGTLNWTASDDAAWLTTTPSGTAPSTMNVSVDITGLTTGTYNGTITVSATGATSQTIAVTLTLGAVPPAIGLSPTTLSFSATAGGANPASQSVNVTNTGGGTLSWTASDNAAWLTTTTSGTAPSTMNVSADIAGLAAGSYNGTITVSSTGATSQTVAVTLTVNAAPPVISLSPTSLGFTTTTGFSPGSQSVNVTNTGGGTLNWTASDDAAWMTTTTSGTAPSTMSVSVDATGMAAGTYSGTITVSATGVAPQIVAVTLTVNAVPAAIGLSPATLTFSATAGGANPASQNVNVTNTGGGTLNWIASDNAAWMTTTTSGTAPSAMSVSVDVSGLSAGTYNGTITVSATGVTPQTVAVSLTLAAAPAIGLNPTTLTFAAPQGGPNPVAQNVTVTNNGGGTLAWGAAETASWLTMTPATGSLTAGASQTMSAIVDVTGLAPGTYTATVSMSAPGASPQTVSVALSVSALPSIGLNPTSLTFAAPQGGPNPVAQNVTVTNTGGGTLAWTGTDNAAWLSLSPAAGSLTAGASQTMSAIVDVAGLAPGTHNATITVTAAGATSQTVAVTLTVSALPAVGVAPSSLAFTAPEGGPNPAIQSFSVSNVGGGTLTWTLSDNAAWMTSTPGAGSLTAGASQNVGVAVDGTGLAAGTYTGTITVTGSGTTQAVAVTLTVNGTPAMGLSSTALTFSAPVGGPNPVSQTVTVTNSGTGVLAWSAVEAATWMSVSPLSGSLSSGASEAMTVTVDVAGLAAGTYTGTITMNAPGVAAQVISVTLTVSSQPLIGLSATSVSLRTSEGSSASQSMAISNVGGGTMTWTMTAGAPWVSMTPSTGLLGASSGQAFTVTAGGMPVGTHTTTIVVTAPGATNSGQVINVTLTVDAAGSDGPRKKCGLVGLEAALILALLALGRRARRA